MGRGEEERKGEERGGHLLGGKRVGKLDCCTIWDSNSRSFSLNSTAAHNYYAKL